MNDMFKDTEMVMRESYIKYMEDDNKYHKKLVDAEKKVIEALALLGCEYDRLKATELTNLLCWHQIPPNEIGGNDSKYNKWREIVVIDPTAHLK